MQTWPSEAAPTGTSPWPPVAGLTTHGRRLLSTLGSPIPSLFIMFKLLHVSFSPICLPHTHTLWWFLLQAGHVFGRPLGDILHPRRVACQQVSVCGLPVPAGGQVCSGMVVSVCLPPPMLNCLDLFGLNWICMSPGRKTALHQARHQARVNRELPSALPCPDGTNYVLIVGPC